MYSFFEIDNFKRRLVKAQNLAVILILERSFRSKKSNVSCVRLGSAYGGWYIPEAILGFSEQKKLLISAGLGFDITFDLEMLKSGYRIVALDPFPPAYKYALSQFIAASPEVQVFQVGLSTLKGKQVFFAPIKEDHDSWSIANIQSSQHLLTKEFEVTTIDGAFEKTGLKRKNFDLIVLKMDIEGAEEGVLDNFEYQNLAPNVVAAELDFLSLIPFLSLRRRITKIRKAFRILRKLENLGFLLVKTDNFNFTWVSRDTLIFCSNDKG